MTDVYAKFDWYQDRIEPEKAWTGKLQERNVHVGPDTRNALNYTLVTKDTKLPIYAANPEAQLAQFVDHLVLIHGKLISLSEEGFGQELWIGSIGIIG